MICLLLGACLMGDNRPAAQDSLAQREERFGGIEVYHRRGDSEANEIAADRSPIPAGGQATSVIVQGAASIGGRLRHLIFFEPGAERKGEASTGPIVVVERRVNRRSIVLVTRRGMPGGFAGINEQGLSVSWIPAKHGSGSKLSRAPNLVVRDVLRKAGSLSQARKLIEQSGTIGTFLVGDGQASDARAFETNGVRTTTFGPNDSAESAPPHRPLPHVLRRSGHFVDAQLDPSDTPALHSWRTESLRCYAAVASLFPVNAGPIGNRECLAWLHQNSANRSGIAVLFDVSDQLLWIGDRREGESGFQQFDIGRWMVDARDSATTFLRPPFAELNKERLARGQVRPAPRKTEGELPAQFRLDDAPFAFEVEPERVSGGALRSKVRFPSPLTTAHPENNTVHAELFRPMGPGPFPCIIVLHIAGGDFELSRFVAGMLARSGLACLFVKMPYYGERRPPGGARMISSDLKRGLDSMRQTVLDLRRACDWIESQPDLNGRRIGVVGISLGAITGSLAAAIEPRITHACLVMGGAGLHHILFESVERDARKYREAWLHAGGTLQTFADVIGPYDPANYADRLRQRVVFMICASEDRTIPRKCALALWEAADKQRIEWYPCGHYTMIRHIFVVLNRSVEFFKRWPGRAENR